MAKLFANIDTDDYGDRFLNDLTDKKKDIKKREGFILKLESFSFVLIGYLII